MVDFPSTYWTAVLGDPTILSADQLGSADLATDFVFLEEAAGGLLESLRVEGANEEVLLALERDLGNLRKHFFHGRPIQGTPQDLLRKLLEGFRDIPSFRSAVARAKKAGGGFLRFAPRDIVVSGALADFREAAYKSLAHRKYPGEYVFFHDGKVIAHDRDLDKANAELFRLQQERGPFASRVISPEGTPTPDPGYLRRELLDGPRRALGPGEE